MNGDDQLGQTSHTDTCATARSLNSSGPQARWDYATFLSAGASEKLVNRTLIWEMDYTLSEGAFLSGGLVSYDK
jgi:hypothetical protein